MTKTKTMKVEKNKTKKVESKKVSKEDIQIDPSMYGYRKGQKIEIDADFLPMILSFANQVSLKETNVYYTPKETAEETIKTAEEKLTDLGMQALRIIQFITYSHIDNAKNGVAVHKDVLDKESQSVFNEVTNKDKKD